MLSGTSLTEGAFVAVDIETTGCLPGRSGIIEIGAARIEAGRVLSFFSELVFPGEPIPYAVQSLTGITDRAVAEAPKVEDVFERFRAFADGAVLIAHNYRFDLGFLDYYAELASGEPFPRPVLDTLALAKRLRPSLGKYNLGALAEEFGAPTRPTHRADADAGATAEIFLAMVPEVEERGVRTVGALARFCRMGGQQSLARKLVLTTGLPDSPGVYALRDARGRVIYVGRAKNLRLRLRSYFYVNGDASGPRLGDETVTVRYIPCQSALYGILLQSRLIDRYHPKHNVTSQRGDYSSLIHVDSDSRFPAVRVVDAPRSTGVNIGPFVNRWAVEALADQLRELYGLRRCSSRITKRLAEKPCEYRGTDDCPSPCVGGIDADVYRQRVDAALTVFEGSAEVLRTSLVERHDRAADAGRHEEAIRYRDALKALDRSMSGLRVVREASTRPGLVIVETDETAVALLFVRHGHLVRTLRLKRSEWSDRVPEEKVRRAMRHAFYQGPYVDDPASYTAQQLKDVFLIQNYRHQVSPLEVEVSPDEDETVSRLLTFLRRHLRVTRRRHVLTSSA